MIKNGAAIIAATDFKYSHPKILFRNFLMNEISGSSLQEEKKIMGGGNLNSLPLYHGKKGKIITYIGYTGKTLIFRNSKL